MTLTIHEPPHEPLIRKILGANYLELKLGRLAIEEADYTTLCKLTVMEGDQAVEVEGKGVGVVDALFHGMLERYAREYQSLKSLELAGFTVSAAIESKRRKAGLDALARVELAVNNSEGKRFTFHDESRSVTVSAARAVIAIAEYFVNAERAFVTLFNARKDALARGRQDLVARYTSELSEVVKSTSYAEVIESLRKELG